MKNNKFSLLLLLIIPCLCFFGCTKNDVGVVDFEQFPNTWTLKEYLEDGIDKSSEISLQNLRHKFVKGGFYGFSYWYTDALGQKDSLIDTSYEFYEDENQLSLYYASDSIFVSNNLMLNQSMHFEVIKLNTTEFWCTHEKDGVSFELRFTSEK
jgi:hypothetical protein